jgi:predicted amidohydrolase YtcJ
MRRAVIALSLVLSGALVAQRGLSSQAAAPDLILVNARVYTVDPAFSTAQAVAIAGGRFTAVGSNADIRKLAGPSTQVMDLAGRTVIPGLQDNHLHNAGGGPGVDLSHARSMADVMRAIAARVREARPSDVVVTNADWHEAQLKEQRLPFRKDLDEVAPETPVVVVRGGHEYILNSAALQKWNITTSTPEPAGGRITRDANGELNGELVDRAKALVTLPPSTRRLDAAYFAEEHKKLAASGLTSIRYPGASADQYRVLQGMRKSGQLTIRIN